MFSPVEDRMVRAPGGARSVAGNPNGARFQRAVMGNQRLPLPSILMKERAMMVLRPGVNALLLAAVALGCAQLGWNALTPNLARGSADAPRPVENAAIRSPFNPSAEEGVGASPAAEAILSSVRLSGVRVASEPALSGAVLTLADGEQRAKER